jgi:peroxiredoxin Q/BCP
VVLGVSPDPIKSVSKFDQKFGLGFTLLADEHHEVAEQYGVWVEKSMYGRKFMGIVRTTFLIGPDQRIARVWPKVPVTGHAEEVLAPVKAL